MHLGSSNCNAIFDGEHHDCDGYIAIKFSNGQSEHTAKAIFLLQIKIANGALLLGALFLMLVGIIYWFYPLELISLYLYGNNTANEATIHLAKIILSISAFTQFFDVVGTSLLVCYVAWRYKI